MVYKRARGWQEGRRCKLSLLTNLTISLQNWLAETNGRKAVSFAFPKQAEDVAFFIDFADEGKRLWFLLTESNIPTGTAIRLSELDEEGWKIQALKHFSKKVRGPKAEGTSGARSTRESIDD